MFLGIYKRTEKLCLLEQLNKGIKSTKILQVWNVCKRVLVPSQRVLQNGLQNETSPWFHDVRAPQRTFMMKQKPLNLEATCKAPVHIALKKFENGHSENPSNRFRSHYAENV